MEFGSHDQDWNVGFRYYTFSGSSQLRCWLVNVGIGFEVRYDPTLFLYTEASTAEPTAHLLTRKSCPEAVVVYAHLVDLFFSRRLVYTSYYVSHSYSPFLWYFASCSLTICWLSHSRIFLDWMSMTSATRITGIECQWAALQFKRYKLNCSVFHA